MDLSSGLNLGSEIRSQFICDSKVSSSDELGNYESLSSSQKDSYNCVVAMPDANPVGSHTEEPVQLMSSLDPMGIPHTWADDEPTFPVSTGSERFGLDYLPLLPTPSTFTEIPELDSQLTSAKSGVCGLRNLGNTCFMNSGLQCLLNNPRLVHFFLDNYEGDDLSKESLSSRFAQLMALVWNGQHTSMKPTEFKESLGRCHPQFRDYRQHDCQEFLALLLDTLHEQLNVGECQKLSEKLKLEEVDSHSTHTCMMEDVEEVLEAKSSLSSSSTSKYLETEVGKEPSGGVQQESTDNSNSTSPHSTDSFGSWEANSSFRMCPVPDEIKPFKDVVANDVTTNEALPSLTNNTKSNNQGEQPCNKNLIPLEALSNCGSSHVARVPISSSSLVEKNTNQALSLLGEQPLRLEKNEFVSSSNVGRILPTIADFAKETKILNTNVLVSEEANNLLKFDSEKFPKMEPPTRPQETLDNLSSLMALESPNVSGKMINSGGLKRVKETNLNHEFKEAPSSSLAVAKRLKLEVSSLGVMVESEHSNDSGSNRSDEIEIKEEGNEEMNADKEWAKYHSKNQTVVVDTFQGQFRSTVICAECGHVSVTFEPFMYLALPLPHALERQIVLTYVPIDNKGLVRYLVTVHKNDKVYKLKEEFVRCLDSEHNFNIPLPQDIVLAEVFDNHISRVLEDNVLIRYVSDFNREIYAFEVSGFDVPDDTNLEINLEDQTTGSSSASLMKMGVGGDHSILYEPLLAESMDQRVTSSSAISGADASTTSTVTSEVEEWEPSVSGSSNLMFSNPIPLPPPTEMYLDDVTSTTRGYGPSTSSLVQSTTTFDRKSIDHTKPPLGDHCTATSSSSIVGGGVGLGDGDATSSTLETNLFNGPQRGPWHMCAICLEDMPDVQLRTHPPCGCTLCHNCIRISRQHYGSTSLICAVCGIHVKPDEDFVPLHKMEDYKAKVVLISVPVVFRVKDSEQIASHKLISHPALLRLPDTLSACTLYDCVDKCVPYMGGTYSLNFVDGQGKNCSRCRYTQKCTGCEVSRQGILSLQIGDNLAVTLEDHSMDYLTIDAFPLIEDHVSMKALRQDRDVPLSLYDCIKAFSQSETLDENNPWYCPVCRCHRQARKSLSVWRCPDTLMVYLKRFMFHEYSSTKVDDPVVFPLDCLDLSQFVTGPSSVEQRPYNLQACVCHFGGVSSGHYTAYAKHTLSGEWYYFNDDTTREQRPQEDDNSHAYILFYQRPGVCPKPSLLKPASSGIIFEKSDMSPDDGSCSSLGLKPDTISHILKQLEDCNDDSSVKQEVEN